MKTTTEVIRRVYDDQDGYFLNVGIDGDCLGCVEVNANGNRENWGNFDRLTLHPAYARALAYAMLATADEVDPPRPDAGNN